MSPAGLLWPILVIVLVVWLIGLEADIVGSAIHLLLVVALVIPIYNLVTRGACGLTAAGKGDAGSRRRAGASSDSDSARTLIRTGYTICARRRAVVGR